MEANLGYQLHYYTTILVHISAFFMHVHIRCMMTGHDYIQLICRICDNRIPQHGSCDVSLETLSSVSSSANDVHTWLFALRLTSLTQMPSIQVHFVLKHTSQCHTHWVRWVICLGNFLCDKVTPSGSKCMQQYSFSNTLVIWSAKFNEQLKFWQWFRHITDLPATFGQMWLWI